jgi:hypothetical protein
MSEDGGPGMATWMIWVVGLAIVIITLLTITAIWSGPPEVGLWPGMGRGCVEIASGSPAWGPSL